MKISKQAQRILNILSDNQFHCPQEWGYADGHCKRITDLKRAGYVIQSETCNCGNHPNKILMRRLIAKVDQVAVIEIKSKEEVMQSVKDFLEKFPSKQVVKQTLF